MVNIKNNLAIVFDYETSRNNVIVCGMLCIKIAFVVKYLERCLKGGLVPLSMLSDESKLSLGMEHESILQAYILNYKEDLI